jgi:tRNA-Thr(GGU) m(6)t(6)A37 methyltransferase TsaA
VSAAGEPVVVSPIGHVRSPRSAAIDDDWGDVVSTISLVADEFDADSLAGLEEFSHVEVVYLFDRIDASAVHRNARHPRNNPDWPRVGIFAQRARNRPNRIGITTCRLLTVSGITVTVEGLDAIDGTPVLDIKPYLAEFGPRGEVRQPAWAGELMAAYWSAPAAEG